MTSLLRRSSVLMLLALFGASTSARADTCISVDVHFNQRAPSPALVLSLQQEASSIWQPYGVRLQWPGNDPAAARCAQIEGSFVVMVQRHRSPLALRSGGTVLGSTHLELVSIERAPIDIDYDATVRTLESLTEARLTALAGHPGLDSVEVGRALGRVLAHEIGHVLLAAPYHQKVGLMRSSFTPADLVAMERRSFTLSNGELTRLRQREQILAAFREADGERCNPCSPR